jgi:transcriptional regulator with XRE-family HTH domain
MVKRIHGHSENQNVERLRRWLIQLGYQEHQIQTEPQYLLKKSVHWQKGHNPVDLAVFRGHERKDEDLLLIAECKSGNGSGSGADQLRRYLKRADCPIGIWFDGVDVAIIFHIRDAISNAAVEAPEDFAALIKQRREQLDADSLHTFNFKKGLQRTRYSIRAVSKQAGIQATYLSKIERKEVGPPSERIIRTLASVLDMDVNKLLIAAGHMPADLQKALLMRPDIAAGLMEALKENPNQTMSDLVLRREVRDGKW